MIARGGEKNGKPYRKTGRDDCQPGFQTPSGEVVRKAKQCLLDTVGAAIAGSRTAEAKVAKRIAPKLNPKKEATLIAGHGKVGVLEAAMANGIMSHALELDDGNRYAQGHPGVATIPAVLALAEKEKMKGRDVIPAIVAGYEVFGRVGAGGNPSHFNRGFHTTGTCGTFAAAAAAGRLLSLNESKMVSALGIAGSQAAGLFAFMADGTMTKTLHAGKAAKNGILAAYLAKEGFTGPAYILEDKRGFLQGLRRRFQPRPGGGGTGREVRNHEHLREISCLLPAQPRPRRSPSWISAPGPLSVSRTSKK